MVIIKDEKFYPLPSLKTAVLFIIFKRLDTTAKVFETIRRVKPPRFYIAADGPREGVNEEKDKVQKVRDYVMSGIDWDCKVKTLFREKNRGSKNAVSEAITWFFENEEMGIILEDDCLPNQSFFRYCEELLERYKDDTRIMQIAGTNFQNGISRTEDSYYFSYHTLIWGWATWRRAWQYYDIDMKLWNKKDTAFLLRQVGAKWKPFERFWGRYFERVATGKMETWDYIWTFNFLTQGGLTIIPEVNLVENIGFGPEAVHCTRVPKGGHIPAECSEMQFPLRHPNLFVRHFEADRYIDRKVYHIKSIILVYLIRFFKIPRNLVNNFIYLYNICHRRTKGFILGLFYREQK
jgi:hypothetical protein